MVRKDLLELVAVFLFKERLNSSFREFFESFISRRKDRERAFAFERFNQPSRLRSRNERLELAGVNRCVYDVGLSHLRFFLLHGRFALLGERSASKQQCGTHNVKEHFGFHRISHELQGEFQDASSR